MHGCSLRCSARQPARHAAAVRRSASPPRRLASPTTRVACQRAPAARTVSVLSEQAAGPLTCYNPLLQPGHSRQLPAQPTWLQRPVVAHAAAVVRVQPQPVPHCTPRASVAGAGSGWVRLTARFKNTPHRGRRHAAHEAAAARGRQQRMQAQLPGRHRQERQAGGQPTRVGVEHPVAALHDVRGAPSRQNAKLQRRASGGGRAPQDSNDAWYPAVAAAGRRAGKHHASDGAACRVPLTPARPRLTAGARRCGAAGAGRPRGGRCPGRRGARPVLPRTPPAERRCTCGGQRQRHAVGSARRPPLMHQAAMAKLLACSPAHAGSKRLLGTPAAVCAADAGCRLGASGGSAGPKATSRCPQHGRAQGRQYAQRSEPVDRTSTQPRPLTPPQLPANGPPGLPAPANVWLSAPGCKAPAARLYTIPRSQGERVHKRQRRPQRRQRRT